VFLEFQIQLIWHFKVPVGNPSDALNFTT